MHTIKQPISIIRLIDFDPRNIFIFRMDIQISTHNFGKAISLRRTDELHFLIKYIWISISQTNFSSIRTFVLQNQTNRRSILNTQQKKLTNNFDMLKLFGIKLKMLQRPHVCKIIIRIVEETEWFNEETKWMFIYAWVLVFWN